MFERFSFQHVIVAVMTACACLAGVCLLNPTAHGAADQGAVARNAVRLHSAVSRLEPAVPGDTYFALVSANGNFHRGRGAIYSERKGRGEYEVLFRRDISRCGYAATVRRAVGMTRTRGEITIAGRAGAGKPRRVYVTTANSAGEPAPLDFFVTVIC